MNTTNDMNSYITSLLDPIIKSVVKCNIREWLLMQSTLYVLADDCILYTINLDTKVDNNITIGNSQIFSKAMEILSKTHTSNIIYDNPELEKDQNFMELATAKASAGAGFYYIDTATYTTFIPVFNGLPALNKGDKVGVKLYQISENKLLVDMNIFKKKLALNYNLYYYILNVNRPIR